MKPNDSWEHRSGAQLDLLQRCKSAIREAAGGADVILYGSRARGDGGEDSDYDIVIVVDEPVGMALEDRIREKVYPLELETGAVITLMVYSRADWDSALYRATPFRQNVDREGVVL